MGKCKSPPVREIPHRRHCCFRYVSPWKGKYEASEGVLIPENAGDGALLRIELGRAIQQERAAVFVPFIGKWKVRCILFALSVFYKLLL